MSSYSLDWDTHNRLFDAAGGKCEICWREDQELVIDHDHSRKIGGVRGVICRRCNHLLGCCADDTDILIRAIYYLSASKVFWEHCPNEKHALPVR